MMNTTHFAMGLLLATLTGCAAEPAAVDEEQQSEAHDALVTIVLFDSVTLGPVADALVCTGAYACETTDHWGTAHLPHSDEDVELTYMAPDYRVHRTFIAADVWGSDRAGYFLPAVKAADVDAALEAAGGAEDDDAGAVLTPVRQTIDTNLEPENDGPVVAVGNWELFSNVPSGSMEFDIFLYAIDEEGGIGDFFTQRLQLDLSTFGDKLTRTGLKMFGELVLPSGDYSLRLFIRETRFGL